MPDAKYRFHTLHQRQHQQPHRLSLQQYEISGQPQTPTTNTAGEQTVATFIIQSEEFLQNRHAIYQPLDPTRREIRLMHILPGQYEDEIQIRLSIVDLADEPSYEAISYTWEDMYPTKQVYVHDFSYNVTVNQYAALRRLRSASEVKVLWMDVVCIDQTNLQERGHQVSIMGEVYANAARTNVWLGDVDGSSYTPFSDERWKDLVTGYEENRRVSSMMKTFPSSVREKLMSEFLQIDGIVERAGFILHQLAADVHVGDLPYCSIVGETVVLCRQWYDAISMLLRILKRPWWTRVWVLQEVLLCRGDPQVLFGPFALPLSVFMKAADNEIKHSLFVKCCMETRLGVFYSNDLINCLFDIANPPNSQHAERPLTPEIMYGVLGLIRPEDRVKVDYTSTTEQVFASTSWHIFRSRNELNYLAFGALSDGDRTSGIPTWSIDWADLSTTGIGFTDSFEMDEEPDWERTKYDGDLELVANKITEIRLVFANVRNMGNEDSSYCRDHYARLWSWLQAFADAGFEIDPTEWTVNTYRHNKFFIGFFATIFRDTIPNVEDINDGFKEQNLEDEDWQAIFEWWNLLNRCMKEDNEQAYPGKESFVTSASFDVQTRGSTLAVITENRLCLVPESSKIGDCIYHIRVCCTPLVLREVGMDIFHVVGAAYLRSSMGFGGWRKEEEKVITLK